ncbi:MAG: hypothetical protein KDK64_08270, partial [Chlamydiia bacterium]|nr:hypothetical protein [Chlamydiia bacterium]
MNKRFLLFALSMTVILFFVNQYLTSQKQQEYEEYQQKQRVLTEEDKLGREINVKERTANSRDLPLHRAFTDINSKESLTWVVSCGNGSYLSTSWQGDWVNVIYVDGKAAQLIQTDDHFALYSESGQPEITSTYLPQLGVHDVQIVSITDNQHPVVTLGEYDDGQLFFPASIPHANGIALYKLEGTYLPVGVYEKTSGTYFPLSKLTHFTSLINYRVETVPQETLNQQEYFVLENETMQVVFSNLGGAIAEINLPFKSKEDHESVVLPVNFDRIIDKKYSSNGRFPNHPYHTVNQSGETVLKDPVLGGYYPLLRRGIEKGSGYPPYTLPPQYYAFNTISEDPETSGTFYKLLRFDQKMIQFEATFPNRRIIKTYTFPEEGDKAAPYCLYVSIKVEGDSRGLWVGSGVPEVELISGSPAPIIKYSTVRNGKHVVEKLSLPKTSTTMSSFQPDWVS